MNDGLEEVKFIMDQVTDFINEHNKFESKGYKGLTTALSFITKDIPLAKEIETMIIEIFKILTIIESGECREYDKYITLFKQKYKKLISVQIKIIKVFYSLDLKEILLLKNTILTKLRKLSKNNLVRDYEETFEEISGYDEETLINSIVSCISYSSNFGNIYQLAEIESLPDEIWENIDEVEIDSKDINDEYRSIIGINNIYGLDKNLIHEYLEKNKPSLSPIKTKLLHDKAIELSTNIHNTKS